MIEIGPSVLETIMLVCFGCSWPFAIARTVRTKTVKGKSIVFMMLILLGYIAGIISKLIYHYDHVIWLYLANGLMVFTEIWLYFKYTRFPNRWIEFPSGLNIPSLRRTKIVMEGEVYGD